jgi:hypothetical protein
MSAPYTCSSLAQQALLIDVCLQGNLKVLKKILQDPRVDPSGNHNGSIRSASTNGHYKVVELLLQDPRVDPSRLGNEAIRRASTNGHYNVVELLLQDPRVDPSSNPNNEAILNASRNGHHKVVELLLQDPRIDPNVLHLIILCRIDVDNVSEETVRILLTKLPKDFPMNSRIITWKHRIDKYCEDLDDLCNTLRAHQDGFRGNEMIDLVVEYLGVSRRLENYEYVE